MTRLVALALLETVLYLLRANQSVMNGPRIRGKLKDLRGHVSCPEKALVEQELVVVCLDGLRQVKVHLNLAVERNQERAIADHLNCVPQI